MADQEPRRRGLRIDPSDLALEIVSIVIAIVLATAVGQFVDSRRAADRTHEALAQIRLELEHDDALLKARRPLHRGVLKAFGATLEKARGEQLDFQALARTFGGAAPHGFQPFAGSTTAWDLARGSNTLADVPYGLRAVLQGRYAELAQLRGENDAFIGRLENAPTENKPNFYFVTVAMSTIVADIVFSEDRLVQDDAAALRALADAGVR